ncbi:MAG: hypothetical protein V1891_02760 [bacterium]
MKNQRRLVARSPFFFSKRIENCFALMSRQLQYGGNGGVYPPAVQVWRNSSPAKLPPSAMLSFSDCPFFSAELETVFCKAKCVAKRNVALDPTQPARGQRQAPYILCIPVWHITLWNTTSMSKTIYSKDHRFLTEQLKKSPH